ncbi:MAG: hypothetical protein UZ21_OP11001000394 [Microgenomates bacterium OLB22]|nr:MAG: hypothetical protein UZ21_OP11001000394 [Microgenomates bacterium OLB22]
MRALFKFAAVAVTALLVTGCERGIDEGTQSAPINTPVLNGASTLVPPLAVPTRAPDRPTAVRPKRDDKNTVQVDFEISIQNACYPSMEDTLIANAEVVTRIANKMPDGSECFGSSTHTAATGAALAVLNFARRTEGMGFVIMNKALSVSPFFAIDTYTPGKAYIIDL